MHVGVGRSVKFLRLEVEILRVVQRRHLRGSRKRIKHEIKSEGVECWFNLGLNLGLGLGLGLCLGREDGGGKVELYYVVEDLFEMLRRHCPLGGGDGDSVGKGLNEEIVGVTGLSQHCRFGGIRVGMVEVILVVVVAQGLLFGDFTIGDFTIFAATGERAFERFHVQTIGRKSTLDVTGL